MKSKLFILLLIFVSVQFVAQTHGSEYDNAQGTSMMPIFMDAEGYIKELEDADFEIVRMEFDILFDYKETYRVLQSDWIYGVYAFGDYRFKQVDLRIYKSVNGEWQQLYEGDDDYQYTRIDETNSVLITLTPPVNTEYKIRIESLECTEGYSGGHYGLFVFHDNPTN